MRHDRNADRSRADTLKIKSIRAVQPASPTAPNDWRTSLGQILVTVETDDGLTGHGVGGGGRASIHVIESVIRRALTGQDSTDVEGLWEATYSLTLAQRRKSLANHGDQWRGCTRAATSSTTSRIEPGEGEAGPARDLDGRDARRGRVRLRPPDPAFRRASIYELCQSVVRFLDVAQAFPGNGHGVADLGSAN